MRRKNEHERTIAKLELRRLDALNAQSQSFHVSVTTSHIFHRVKLNAYRHDDDIDAFITR